MARYIPLVIIAALLGLAAFGAHVKTYPAEQSTYCAFDFARLKEPPADILVMGTSRSGRGIDPVYVEKQIKEMTGKDIAVQRLSLAEADIAGMHLLSLEYLRSHGAPKTLVLQVAYNVKPAFQSKIGNPVHAPRSIMLANTEDLAEVQRAEGVDYSHKGARMTPAVLMDKLATDINAALKYPSLLLNGTAPGCGDAMRRQSSNWLYGDLPGAPAGIDPRDHGTPEDWNEEALAFLPLDPTAEFRAFEERQLKALVTLYQSHGTKVLFTLYPTFRQPIEGVDGLAKRYPDIEFVDLITPFNKAVRGKEAEYFVDPNHVNPIGALILSEELARQMSSRFCTGPAPCSGAS